MGGAKAIAMRQGLLALPILGLALILLAAQPYNYSFALPPKLSINATEAYELGRALAKGFPHKSSGSEDAARAAQWLAEKLSSWGYSVTVQEFKARLGEEVTLRNVVALRQGSMRGEALLVLTNYDQAPTTVEAASDTSAAVGAVLALAHALSKEALRRDVAFAFVDGEEWGMLGAGYLAKHYPWGQLPAAAIVAEDVDVGMAAGIDIDPVGQFAGYSPLWLRELVKACALSLGLSFSQPSGLYEYAQRAVLISFTDQGPLLGQGLTSVLVSTWGDRPELQREVYHGPGDVYELIEPQAVGAYGRVLECAVRALDEMPYLPKEGHYYLLVEEGRAIGSPWLLVAQVALLAPLYVNLALCAGKIRGSALRELACYALALSTLLASYGVAKLLPRLGLMPYYELYPPPPRHPALYSPNYAAMALWLALTTLALYLAIRASLKLSPEPEGARAMELAVLSLLLLMALALNPFGATLLLLPTAYLWPYIRPAEGVFKRVLSLALLTLGGFTVFLLIYTYASRIYLTIPLMLWYLFMGVAYGLFTPASMLLLIAVLNAGLRLLLLSLGASRSGRGWLEHRHP